MANNDNGVKSIIIHRINNQTKSDLIRFPYKSVYGIPKSLNCDESIHERFDQCEYSIQRKWEVSIPDYVSLFVH